MATPLWRQCHGGTVVAAPSRVCRSISRSVCRTVGLLLLLLLPLLLLVLLALLLLVVKLMLLLLLCFCRHYCFYCNCC